MPSKMINIKVLWLVRQLDFGGTEKLLINLAKYSKYTNLKITLYSVFRPNEILENELIQSGITVVSACAKSLKDFRWINHLRKTILHNEFDIIHTHSPTPAIAVRIFYFFSPRKIKSKFVTTEHGSLSSYRPLLAIAESITAFKDDKIICVSKDSMYSLPKYLWKKTTVVHHGIDVTSIELIRSKGFIPFEIASLKQEGFVITTVANFRWEKDYDTLLEAIKLLSLDNKNFNLIIIGLGDDSKIRQKIKDLKIDSRVHLLGPKENAIVYIAASDIFVLSSHSEGLPVVLMEAAACGVPVVATRVGGVAEIVHHEYNGLLVAPHNPKEFYKALARLLYDNDLRLLLATNQRKVAQLFDVKRVAELYQKHYQEVLRS
jgi:glycosyltransferase involved in cell wall biosynthesis